MKEKRETRVGDKEREREREKDRKRDRGSRDRQVWDIETEGVTERKR